MHGAQIIIGRSELIISDVSFDTKKQLVAATFLDYGDTNASARCLGAVDTFCSD